jgi:lipid A ethanolaminephosphotransferase
MLIPNRPQIPHLALNFCVAAYILAALNSGFLSHFRAIFGSHALQGAMFLVAIFALTVLTLELFGPGRLQKPVALLLIITAAAANYFERTYGVLVDREMVRNVMETTLEESKHLATMDAGINILISGVLPSLLVLWVKVSRVGPLGQLWRWPLGVTVCIVIVLGSLFTDYKSYSAIFRERKELMMSYQPGATIGAVARYGKQQLRAAAGPVIVEPVATDAVIGGHLRHKEKPVLLVFFVGETARAQNFALNGYEVNTTPRLSRTDVINFSNAISCGTSTAVSVPCLFSPFARSAYSYEEFISHENLLDVLQRVGFDVRWKDNNTGDQRVAARIGWSRVDASVAPDACVQECTDDVFLPVIRDTLEKIERDTVLVLHMIGNHGPAYFLRYGSDVAEFQPDCRSIEFSECSVGQIVNSYDNAVLETDKVLAETIAMLRKSEKVLPAMIYVSDHGESLGENGLYLHAAPWLLAPEVQTHVPVMLWVGDAFAQEGNIDRGCIRAKSRQNISHDNIFHSVLGLLDIETESKDADLDLFGTCRS